MKSLIKTPLSKLRVIDNYLIEEECQNLIDHIHSLQFNIEPKILVRGVECTTHREMLFVSSDSEGYKFSGQISKDSPMTKELGDLIKRINKEFDTEFNGILLNKYRSGDDYIGAHSDDRKGLSQDSVVMISLGATRIFRIRPKKEKIFITKLGSEENGSCEVTKFDIEVKNGQFLVMAGKFQDEFTHEVPVQKRVKEERISLTFRYHKE